MIFSEVFYVDYDRSVKFNSTLHSQFVKKFLAWPNLIIVGPQYEHKYLYNHFCADHTAPPTSQLIAAGDCTVDGHVWSWTSVGFGFKTPKDIKPHILKAIQMKDKALGAF